MNLAAPEDRRGLLQPRDYDRCNALKFYCTVRLDIRRKMPIKRGDETMSPEPTPGPARDRRSPSPRS